MLTTCHICPKRGPCRSGAGALIIHDHNIERREACLAALLPSIGTIQRLRSFLQYWVHSLSVQLAHWRAILVRSQKRSG